MPLAELQLEIQEAKGQLMDSRATTRGSRGSRDQEALLKDKGIDHNLVKGAHCLKDRAVLEVNPRKGGQLLPTGAVAHLALVGLSGAV